MINFWIEVNKSLYNSSEYKPRRFGNAIRILLPIHCLTQSWLLENFTLIWCSKPNHQKQTTITKIPSQICWIFIIQSRRAKCLRFHLEAAGKMSVARHYRQPVTVHIDQLAAPIAPYPKIHIEHQAVKDAMLNAAQSRWRSHRRNINRIDFFFSRTLS